MARTDVCGAHLPRAAASIRALHLSTSRPVPDTSDIRRSENAGVLRWIGLACLAAGLLGHVLAAQAIGGSFLAYRDHLLGFVGLTVVSGAVLALIGWRFWRGRPERTVLVLGVVQLLFGVVAYVMRFSVHG